MITFEHHGSFRRTMDFLHLLKKPNVSLLNKFGEEGVAALREATPKDTGLTARSWYYRIVQDDEQTSIQWLNSNVKNGVPIAIILQYGHATGTDGYVEGVDYINPAIKPIFDRIAQNIWKEARR